MTMGIYKIINVINNKFYVGSAVNLSRRKTRHFSELRTNKHNNRYLQAAWNKYGEPAFIFAVIQPVENKDELLAAENVWLREHVGKDYCYNLGVDATAPMLGKTGKLSPTWGLKHNLESLQKIGVASKARIQSEEEKLKRRITMKGHIVPTATRLKISQTLQGEGNYWFGKQRPEFALKVSKAVLATDNHGGQTVFPSISALREALGIKPPTINRALKSGNIITRGKYTGWSFKYK
jgi:group I intron endonuclease